MAEIMKPSSVKQLNSWSSLPFRQRLQVVDVWTLVTIVSNVFHFVGVILIMFPEFNSFKYQKLDDFMIGLGTFLIILSLTSYLQFDEALNILPATVMNVTIGLMQ